MNKRTLELYRQAQVPHTAIDPSNNMPYETTTFSAEKFAELIVKECISVMDTTAKEARENFTYMDNDVPTTAHQYEIRKHFGVEE